MRGEGRAPTTNHNIVCLTSALASSVNGLYSSVASLGVVVASVTAGSCKWTITNTYSKYAHIISIPRKMIAKFKD